MRYRSSLPPLCLMLILRIKAPPGHPHRRTRARPAALESLPTYPLQGDARIATVAESSGVVWPLHDHVDGLGKRSCGARTGRWRRRQGYDPSPVSPRLVKAPATSHPLPSEREMVVRARERRKRPTFSEGRRWAATGVLISRRGPDEGSLPVLRLPIACHAQPRVGRFPAKCLAWRDA